jgi:hypothetical protein
MKRFLLSLTIGFTVPLLSSAALCDVKNKEQHRIPAAQGNSTREHDIDGPKERVGFVHGKALKAAPQQLRSVPGPSRIKMAGPGIQRLVPQEYPTIQAGIDASSDGDTVLVSDGTYVENINFRGRRIMVASLYLLDQDTSHISGTVIDGSQGADTGSVVCFVSGEDTNSVLCGFTIRGGFGTYIPVWDEQDGGGVLLWESGGRLVRNIITGNSVYAANAWGGGVSMTGLTNTGQILIMEDNIIDRNIATGTVGVGFGGGVSIFRAGGFRLTGNSFEYDSTRGMVQSGASGVLVYLSAGGLGVVSGNVFRNNTVLGDSSSYACLVIAQYEGEVVVDGNLFEDNSVMSTNLSAYGGSIYVDNLSVITPEKRITGNVIRRTLQTSGLGYSFGGAMIVWDTRVKVAENLIQDNMLQAGTYAYGGGIYGIGWAGSVENNIITGNHSEYGGGMGHAVAPPTGTYQVIVNNTISGNSADFGGGFYGGTGTTSILLNNIIWGDSSLTGEIFSIGNIEAHYSNIDGGWSGGTGNINLDPMFVDTLYHLSDASPCIGAGGDSVDVGGTWYRSVASDFGGNPRPMPLGSAPDMGAWENPLAIPTDVGDGQSDLPVLFELGQNYPNPFNPVTTIRFDIPVGAQSAVSLRVYDVLGREIATLVNEQMNPGTHEAVWDATGMTSGVYFYKLSFDRLSAVKKLVLLH